MVTLLNLFAQGSVVKQYNRNNYGCFLLFSYCGWLSLQLCDGCFQIILAETYVDRRKDCLARGSEKLLRNIQIVHKVSFYTALIVILGFVTKYLLISLFKAISCKIIFDRLQLSFVKDAKVVHELKAFLKGTALHVLVLMVIRFLGFKTLA